MCAENYLRPPRFGEARQGFIHLFDDSIEIHRITIEAFHAMNWDVAGEQTPPLIQT